MTNRRRVDAQHMGNTTIVRPKQPTLLKKEFTLPDKCSCKTFVMRELTADDELQASMWADMKITTKPGNQVLSMMGVEQQEAMRLALVSVDGVPVNVEGLPFADMDNWTYRTMRFVQAAFQDLNGVDATDLRSFTTGAVIQAGQIPQGHQPQEIDDEGASSEHETA